MSVESIINDWNSDPTIGGSTQEQPQRPMVEQPVNNAAVNSQSFEQPKQSKSMLDRLAEKGVDVNRLKPQPTKTKAQEIEEVWNAENAVPTAQKKLEDMTDKEFRDMFSTMDMGENTAFERFLFGNTADKANTAQSFLRGVRGELSDTGLGIKQRIDDVRGADEETLNKNELMRQQSNQQTKTNHPFATGAGQVAGTIAELAPLAVTGTGALPLLAEGAAYGATRPQKEGYDAADIALSTGGEALISLVGGKATQKLVDMASPIVKAAYSKITGKTPAGKLISDSGEPSEELLEALRSQGIEYEELLDGAGVFKEMKNLLKAQPVGADPEQAVRASRFESLGIKPTKTSVVQSVDQDAQAQVLKRQINDPEATALRDALGEESEGFKSAVMKLAEEAGDPDVEGLGFAIRDAIKTRVKSQQADKSDAYKLLAEEAGKTGEQIGVPVDDIVGAWNSSKKIKRSQMQGFHSDVKESLMRYGVVEPDEAFNKMVQKGEEEIVPLSANNFESLRQELNANINPQDPATSAILKPIISKLDESVDAATEGFKGGEALTELSKSARGKAREFSKEFNSKNMVSDILKTKTGTFDTYQIRGQDIFNKLIKTSRKTPTAEQLTEVITTLEKSGPKGQKAIADMQSATIMSMLKEATSQLSAKGTKGQQFSYTAFRKALDGVGDKEMQVLFKNNPNALNQLKELGKAAADSQTFSDAIPKGSAADMQNMFTRSFAPLFETIGFAKAGFIGRLAAQSLAEKAGERVSKSKLRKAVAEEIKAKPEIRKELTKLTKQYPGVFESIGIALSTKSLEDEE